MICGSILQISTADLTYFSQLILYWERRTTKKRRPASHQSVNKLSFSVKWETCKADLVQDSPFSQVFFLSVLDFVRTRLRCSTWGWGWFLEAGINSTSAKMSSIAYFRISIFEPFSKDLVSNDHSICWISQIPNTNTKY